MSEGITIRRATAADREVVRRLAELDSRRAPRGATLLAFVDDDLRAALPLEGGEPVANPFHRTAEIVDLLRLRAAQADAPATFRRRRHVAQLGLLERGMA